MEKQEGREANRADNPGVAQRAPLAFLLPTFKTPLLTGDLLHAASSLGIYEGVPFLLLLDAEDPHLLAYRALVEGVREKGLDVGYLIFDGTPYCGKINRVAPIVSADAICVIDSTHLPRTVDGGPLAKVVDTWAKTCRQPMQVGVFTDTAFYPVVTRKLIDRLGYMFHPLCYGRMNAENWLLSLAGGLEIQSTIPGCSIIESHADGVEIVGVAEDEDDARWAERILEQIVEEEMERLDRYILK